MSQITIENVNELADRWSKARRAALQKSFTTELSGEDTCLNQLATLQETEFNELLKSIFLNSRKLGLGFQRQFGLVWELSDLGQFLGHLDSPCLKGQWERTAHAQQLVRLGCSSGLCSNGENTQVDKLGGLRVCQYWREAIDGLVTGLCDDERFVRHQCQRAGDSQCTDIFFLEDLEPSKSRWSSALRWGPLPQDKIQPLKGVEENFGRMKVSLNFLGLAEGRLYYKMESNDSLSCGTAGNIMRTRLESLVSEFWQGVTLQDASPVAVYGERA